jgi:hypothetical protein
MLYLYLLIPVMIGLSFYCLVLLGKYAWQVKYIVVTCHAHHISSLRPPTAKERAIPHPPQYPHPFLWQPFSIGMLASICVQAMRYPVYEGLEIALDAISSKAKTGRQVAYIGRRQSRHISGLLASLL